MPNQKMGSFLTEKGAFHVPGSKMAWVPPSMNRHYRIAWPAKGAGGAVLT